MSIVDVDSKGRIVIPKRFREEMGIGDKVLIINVGSHLKIIPLPRDPFKVLDGAFSVRKSFRELRRQAERQALKEIGGKDAYRK